MVSFYGFDRVVARSVRFSPAPSAAALIEECRELRRRVMDASIIIILFIGHLRENAADSVTEAVPGPVSAFLFFLLLLLFVLSGGEGGTCQVTKLAGVKEKRDGGREGRASYNLSACSGRQGYEIQGGLSSPIAYRSLVWFRGRGEGGLSRGWQRGHSWGLRASCMSAAHEVVLAPMPAGKFNPSFGSSLSFPFQGFSAEGGEMGEDLADRLEAENFSDVFPVMTLSGVLGVRGFWKLRDCAKDLVNLSGLPLLLHSHPERETSKSVFQVCRQSVHAHRILSEALWVDSVR
uniref:Uncharacterized protein n=1 Tax=Chromera velia CCMP2878 TaxID=1169474 RepID=A0A0G4FJ80_9ALVE|eukprot:Cvel_17337.t1-p1 / transcript=Cvel_17337.t1 / gene=Cvel_17337 / organism=Chromera_velia_CCMP2878 / gene_product=hypothetical protein / transcript_product=hypothetical protein / location=Cvel_scaffold1377:37661-38530(+) / protein_length=290 / sequence_SO=supercontig / SO=protein_coding / is_pseudo=false